MPLTHSDLYAEVRDLVRSKIDGEQIIGAAWVVPLMTQKHPMPTTWRGPDADAYRICFREHVKDMAREVVREFKKTEEEIDPRQGVLTGFKRVQRSYQIERNGEPMLVPVGKMSDVEVERKIEELRKIGAGNLAHADELERYLRDRRAVESA
jgi:hypothetical protein